MKKFCLRAFLEEAVEKKKYKKKEDIPIPSRCYLTSMEEQYFYLSIDDHEQPRRQVRAFLFFNLLILLLLLSTSVYIYIIIINYIFIFINW